MSRQRTWTLVLVAALALFLFRRPITLAMLRHEAAPRPAVGTEPIQGTQDRQPFEHVARGRRYRIVPRFRWDESARVLSEEPYRMGAAGGLIPVDWVLGWGLVLSPPYSEKIHYTQVSRFYMWGTKDLRLDRGTIVSHTANTHVIPGTLRLRRAAAMVRRGDDVRLEGWLVDVDGIDDPSFHWRTSISRTDEGPGGCETVYLTRLTVNTRLYR